MPAVPSGEFYSEAFLQYADANGNSKTIVFDAVLDEQWPQGATVTEHPVEQGANVADHVRVALVTCTLKVRVTNEPADSNQFADPIGGAGQTTALALSVPTPNQPEFDGIVIVPTWQNNSLLSSAIVDVASFAGEAASGVATDIAQNLTGQGAGPPLGNELAASLKPTLQPTETGNRVLTYPNPPHVAGAGIAGQLVRIVDNAVGGIAGAAVFDAITSLIPPGEEIDLPVSTDAGMPGGDGIPVTVTAQTVQFAVPTDFAAKMIALLGTLKDAAQLFTVYGSKQTLASMVIETLIVHRGAPEETGTGADITIGLKQVRIVSTQTVAAPLPSIPRAKAPVNVGAQDPYAAPTGTQKSLVTKIGAGEVNLINRVAGYLAGGGA